MSIECDMSRVPHSRGVQCGVLLDSTPLSVGIILSASNTYATIRLVQAFKDGNFLGVCKPA